MASRAISNLLGLVLLSQRLLLILFLPTRLLPSEKQLVHPNQYSNLFLLLSPPTIPLWPLQVQRQRIQGLSELSLREPVNLILLDQQDQSYYRVTVGKRFRV